MRRFVLQVVIAGLAAGLNMSGVMAEPAVVRLVDAPLVSVEDPRLGGNVNGPSLIRVPDWVADPLGRYYLYFSHHEGDGIRLAYADRPEGPWQLHEPGALSLADSLFPTERPPDSALAPEIRARQGSGRDFVYPHIASPDVVVDPETRSIRLYYHGLLPDGRQATRVATSSDGLDFTAHPEVLGAPYFRVFHHAGWWWALAMPGLLYRSADGLTGFERGPTLFEPDMRHSAVLVRDGRLHVFWTRVGDAPERILHSVVRLTDDWRAWQAGPAREVLRPEREWEGASLPVAASVRGSSMAAVNELRDPAVFEEDGDVLLLYSVAGEQGIGLARLAEGLFDVRD